ncbi:MAG: hypothetical protein IID15_05830 [Candidatus Marinimicrobia bacterium]|nr:hypothetical protein [Candidatus Neomarinimicrobiota bacterium]
MKSFSGTDPSLPDFEILYLFLGWGLSLPLPFQVRLHTGFNFGINRMVFDHLTGFGRTESEVGLILLLELSRPLTPNLALRSSVGRQTIFTYERIHLLHYTAGLSYTIRTPQLIKELLE